MSDVKLLLGDCLQVLPTLEPSSIDMIAADLPYGTTACAWDTVIPFEPMWAAVKHVLKPRGVFVTTASQPFTSALVMSNPQWFKCEWIWNKVLGTGHLNSGKLPLKVHENIIMFSSSTNGNYVYNPIMIRRGIPRWKGGAAGGGDGKEVYGAYGKRKSYNNEYFPTSIVVVSNGDRTREEVGNHPTKKPISLYEYLILTYTNPGDTVLDMCAGSGTTGVACIKTGRHFIGIEKQQDYFEIMQRRIAAAQRQMLLPIEIP